MLSLKFRKVKILLITTFLMVTFTISAKESNSATPLSSHTKLDGQYCITYGNPRAKIQLVEYFSLSCPLCLKLLKQDFPKLKEKYVCSGDVFWVLHPDPADILTLQMMECLGKLSDREKQIFFEGLLTHLTRSPSKKIVCWMQAILEEWGREIPQLQELSFLETTTAFQDAYKYVQQANAPKEVPTIEINGEVKETFPSYAFIDKTISDLLEVETQNQKPKNSFLFVINQNSLKTPSKLGVSL